MYEKLVSYAANQLELNPDEITRESTFESLGIDSLDIVEMIMDLESELGIDSLDIVEMIMDLESELGIELELEDQRIATFGELAEFIDSKVN